MDRDLKHAAAVTPSDVADLPNQALGLYLGSAGHVKVTTVGGETVTLTTMAAGVIHRGIAIQRIWSTGTAAGSIIAFW